MKKLFSFILVSALLLSFSGCSPAVIYQDEDVKVSLMDPNLESVINIYEWIEMTDERAFEMNELIAEGTISNIREIEIMYRYMDADLISYYTLIDFTLTDIIYQPSTLSETVGNTITVAVSYNTYTHGEGFPIINDGKNVILFCSDTSKYADNPLKLSAYADYLAGTPNYLILEKVDGLYLTNEYFVHSLKEANGKRLTAHSKLTLSSQEKAADILRSRYYMDSKAALSSDQLWTHALFEPKLLKEMLFEKAQSIRGGM